MMFIRQLSGLLLVAFFLFGFFKADATHLRAGDITIKRLSCNSNTFQITLHVYTRTSVVTKFSMGGAGSLNFGDGSAIFHPPEIDFPPIIGQSDNGPIGEVTFTVTHTYGSNGLYTITYSEQNRNEGILNIDNSVNTPFFMQTQILIDDGVGCNNSPELLVPPIDRGCTGVKWFHNPGAYDPDGDSLSYELFVPKQGAVYDDNGVLISSLDVGGYRQPNNNEFYTGSAQKEPPGVGPATFSIDPLTGTLTWDAPGEAGEYNVAFLIREWRKVFGQWVCLGYVERDMQIVIQNCTNQRPQLQVPADICVTAGTLITEDIYATDPDGSTLGGGAGKGDSVKIEAFSQIFSINPNKAKISPDSGVWQPTLSPVQQAHIQLKWQTACEHVKEQPYEVVFKATDNGSPPLSTFDAWKIMVVAPAPIWNTITLNPGQRSSQLSWQPYACKSATNAATMQVWRRVDSSPFTPSTCITGIPDSLGYTMIGEVPIGSSGFLDQKLAAGAEYCYRLVATFSDGSLSYVSTEYCIPPILADAPVITNVTIDSTDLSTGKITIKWRSPFEADQGQFPKPYTFVVMRAEGFNGNINLITVSKGQQSDSTFSDDGLNTRDLVYNYRIIAFASNGNRVDTSAAASSVRLDLKPQFKQVQLTWGADVPWSNNTPQYPIHLIYRTPNSLAETISELTLIDSVNVTQRPVLMYVDSGQYNGVPLDQKQNYCYAVMTRGSYGNPKIKAPLINFSEITCAIPGDTLKPCKPLVVATGGGCSSNNTFCPGDGNTGAIPYSNVVRWKRPADTDCRADIRKYNVYASSDGQNFNIVASVVDTFYVDAGLNSSARCYKISSVNRAGKESDLTDQFCFDNCPYYALPNVFTPNGDGCNDLFSAYSIRRYGDPDSGDYPPCNTSTDQINNIKTWCARFVLSVNFTVYNRWGREVYNYQGNGNDGDQGSGVFIDWNGKDNAGRDLDAGTYYYVANVVFNVVDPKRKSQTVKGWVQLMR
ncbi:MAG: gliding motility-associated C-terminal domain-containing protein [Bacteroidetes bacterium]|nr:gliding motility-associated C-terminal domain-containing protein [Bacteroidota bacterium]